MTEEKEQKRKRNNWTLQGRNVIKGLSFFTGASIPPTNTIAEGQLCSRNCCKGGRTPQHRCFPQGAAGEVNLDLSAHRISSWDWELNQHSINRLTAERHTDFYLVIFLLFFLSIQTFTCPWKWRPKETEPNVHTLKWTKVVNCGNVERQRVREVNGGEVTEM